MKKIIFNLLGVFLCGLTTQAAADYCSQNYNDCCEWSVLDGKMTIGADWLYWKVQQDGILPGRIIVENTTNENDNPVLFTRARGIHTDPKWKNGFRIHLGYELPCDSWDVNLSYTYMPSREKIVNFTAGPTESFVSPFINSDFDFFASKWNLSWNTVDLDIGRTICFGDCLKLRPHVGFRATWIDQKFRSFGAANVAVITPATVSFDALSLKQKFQGYGVEAGLWTDYKLSSGLSLIGHFGGSILYSKFNVHSKEANGYILIEDNSTISDIQHGDFVATNVVIGRDTFFTATPTLDYFIGLQYADTLCDMLYKIYVGWEQHVLFDTNRFLARGNLSGQGLTLGLQVGF